MTCIVEDSESTHERRHEIESSCCATPSARCNSLRVSIASRHNSSSIRPDILPRPFVEEGFRRYHRIFLAMPIEPSYSGACSSRPSRPLPPDIEIHRWSDADYQPSANIITSAYSGHVDSDVNDQYRTIAGSFRFLNNIVRFPGCGVFDPSSSFVAFHRPTHTRIGILLCSRVRHDVGHITQVCTLPEYRSSGIGEHLVNCCYADLAARRFTELSLTVTEENQRAYALYRRLGFRHVHTFDGFVWEV